MPLEGCRTGCGRRCSLCLSSRGGVFDGDGWSVGAVADDAVVVAAVSAASEAEAVLVIGDAPTAGRVVGVGVGGVALDGGVGEECDAVLGAGLVGVDLAGAGDEHTGRGAVGLGHGDGRAVGESVGRAGD